MRRRLTLIRYSLRRASLWPGLCGGMSCSGRAAAAAQEETPSPQATLCSLLGRAPTSWSLMLCTT